MKLWILFFPFTLVLSCTVFGQETGPSPAGAPRVVLTGTVYDINGGVILNAQLLARSFAGKEYQATTNTEGIYKIELPLDAYKIEANAPGFCPKRVEMFRVSKSPLVHGKFSLLRKDYDRHLDFVLELPPSETPGIMGYRPCKQKTMIKKEPQIRHPEIFRSIAE
jgi:hypothetical protein